MLAMVSAAPGSQQGIAEKPKAIASELLTFPDVQAAFGSANGMPPCEPG